METIKTAIGRGFGAARQIDAGRPRVPQIALTSGDARRHGILSERAVP